MPESQQPKIQPWKALSSDSLAEDKSPDFTLRNLDKGEISTADGSSVMKPMPRKTEAEEEDEMKK
jgi:hypothetical protein